MKKHIIADLKIHTVKMRLLLIGIVVIFLSCKGQMKTSSQRMNSDTNPLIPLVLQDNYSGSDTSEILIIKDYKRLNSFFSKVNRVRKPGLLVPEIDFSKDMVIVLCNGKQNEGLWPRLYLLKETEEKIILEIVQKNDIDEPHTASISPFCIYKMPLTSKEMVFKETD
jgi:hypothetical protein